jgi:F-type H+-transporting ATPase subunit b
MWHVDWGLQLWTLLTFAGLLILLARFVFKPLQKVLSDREDAIRTSLEKAETIRVAAEKATEENRKQMEQARQEALQLIVEGQQSAALARKEAEAHAREEAVALIADARREIDTQLQDGLEQLKSTVANLSVDIARQVLKETMDEKRHLQLTEESIRRLKDIHAIRPS